MWYLGYAAVFIACERCLCKAHLQKWFLLQFCLLCVLVLLATSVHINFSLHYATLGVWLFFWLCWR